MRIKLAVNFKKEFKELSKKFHKIIDDYEELLKLLEENPTSGKNLGNSCYKIRLKNSDLKKGKSSGYRVITYVIKDNIIHLLSIYAKGEKETISDKEILNILEEENLR